MNNEPPQPEAAPSHIIVVESRHDWTTLLPHHTVVLAKDYLSEHEYFGHKGIKVINLCRSYGYLSTGYYVSLLAEARRHKVVPSIKTISELSRKSLYSLESGDLDDIVQKRLRRLVRDSYAITVFFGQCSDPMLEGVAQQIFDLFPCPLLRIEFEREQKWSISRIKAFHLNQLNAAQRGQFADALSAYFSKRWHTPRLRNPARYDLAVLYNYSDPIAPSNQRFLSRLMSAGKDLDVNVEVIERKDYSKLPEYDALFIRETTGIDNHTYRFARKAENEDMVVIDDPGSILKCTNKIYLAELLRAHRVPRPRTVIVGKDTLDTLPEKLPFPIVLKIPDGSFSRGVFKADNRAELETLANKMFEESDLLLAQEFVYTAYDWRIGVLNRQPLFACQYFMSKDHWQILKYDGVGKFRDGDSRTLPVNDVPRAVMQAALRAANLIGDGLYGVDLKQNAQGVYVIEVNDNPNIEAGVEDLVTRDTLYHTLLGEFVHRLEQRRPA